MSLQKKSEQAKVKIGVIDTLLKIFFFFFFFFLESVIIFKNCNNNPLIKCLTTFQVDEPWNHLFRMCHTVPTLCT
jgi:hypothetical protein